MIQAETILDKKLFFSSRAHCGIWLTKIRTMKLLYKVYKFQDAIKHVLLHFKFLAFFKENCLEKPISNGTSEHFLIITVTHILNNKMRILV